MSKVITLRHALRRGADAPAGPARACSRSASKRRTCYDAGVNTWSIDLVTVRTSQDECTACGHAEDSHVLEDVPGSLDKRGLCAECEEWHEFTPPQST